jgi:hypothetical protein
LQAINPEIVVQLRTIRPFSTLLISLALGLAYYQAIKPLAYFKQKLEKPGTKPS